MTIESVVTQEKPVIEIFSTKTAYTVVQKNKEELVVLGPDIKKASTTKARNPNTICVVAADPLEGEHPAVAIYHCETYKGIDVDHATILAERIAMRFPGKEVLLMKSTDRRIKGNTVWKSEALLKFATLLFIDERTEELPNDGLFIPDELASRIVAGDKDCVIKTSELDIPAGGREFVLASDMAYGLIKIAESTEIDLPLFKELETHHRIDNKLRKKLFSRKKKFHLYKIDRFTPFNEPRSYFVPDELDHIVEDFEILSKQEKDSIVVQTLLFPKSKFKTAAKAKAWAKEHGFKSGKIDETDKFFRLRQKDPGQFKRLRTFTMGGGVKATGGPLKKADEQKVVRKDEPKKINKKKCPEEGMVYDSNTGECVRKQQKLKKFRDGFPMVDPFGEEGGVHAHALRRDGGVTAEDGAHKHLYLLPEGTELPDGTILDRDISVTTMESGAHWHSLGEGESGKEASAHRHLLILPDGSTIQTSEDGKHSHEQLVRTTTFDGIHTHSLTLPDGTKIQSMTPEEFVERHPGAGFNSGSIHSASDVLLLEKSKGQEAIEESETNVFKVDITRVCKADEERTVLGVVMEPEETDSQGDITSAEEIEKTMELYMEEFRNFKVMHKGKNINNDISILQSYIAPIDFEMGGQQIKKGSWLMKLRIKADEIWEKVKSGEFTGYSIGGHSKAILL